MRLKACICNCVKSLKIGGISPMMQPLKNCAFSLCETLNKIGNASLTWRQAANQFAILFGERFTNAMKSFWCLGLSHKIPDTTNSDPGLTGASRRPLGACRPSRSRPFHRTTGRLDHGPPSAFPTARSDRPPGKIDRCSTDEMGNLELDPLSSPLDGFFAPLQLKRIHRHHVPAVRRLFEACLSLTRASTSEHRRGRAYQRL